MDQTFTLLKCGNKNLKFDIIRKAGYVSATLALLLTLGCCSFLVYQSRSLADLHEQTSLLKKKYHCYEQNITEKECDDCIERFEIHHCVYQNKQERKWNELPANCVSEVEVQTTIHKSFDAEWRGHLVKIKPEKFKDYLANAVDQCYSPNRFIVHWFALEEAGIGMKHDRWQLIKKYERDESVYTVSPGFPDTYNDGAAMIPKNGLYWVYGKVTVACTQADNQLKRIPLEIRTREIGRETDQTILTDLKSAKCSLVGDLVSLYANGLFRFAQGNGIYMRIKLPIHVKLADNDSIYKTNFGVGWMGFS